MYMFNQCYCCYSKPILDVADNKFAESAAVLMLMGESYGSGRPPFFLVGLHHQG
jgi:hypothetical protein